VLNEPIRVKDSSTGNYILLKDAVVKGLVSSERSTSRVDLKNRASFLTHNRVSYIIDWVVDPAAAAGASSARYSLQEAVKRGLFSNGHVKWLKSDKIEQVKLDEAIAARFVGGKRVDLDTIDSRFKSSVTFPEMPPKPSRGIFVSDELNASLRSSEK
jgi:hypothetical protein